MTEMMTKVPTLREFIGDGARADGFEAYIAESLETNKRVDLHANPYGRAWGKLFHAASIAFIEIGKQLYDDGLFDEAVVAGPDAMAFALAAATRSVLKDDTPQEVLERHIREGVDAGLKRFFASSGWREEPDLAVVNEGLEGA